MLAARWVASDQTTGLKHDRMRHKMEAIITLPSTSICAWNHSILHIWDLQQELLLKKSSATQDWVAGKSLSEDTPKDLLIFQYSENLLLLLPYSYILESIYTANIRLATKKCSLSEYSRHPVTKWLVTVGGEASINPNKLLTPRYPWRNIVHTGV